MLDYLMPSQSVVMDKVRFVSIYIPILHYSKPDSMCRQCDWSDADSLHSIHLLSL